MGSVNKERLLKYNRLLYRINKQEENLLEFIEKANNSTQRLTGMPSGHCTTNPIELMIEKKEFELNRLSELKYATALEYRIIREAMQMLSCQWYRVLLTERYMQYPMPNQRKVAEKFNTNQKKICEDEYAALMEIEGLPC